MNFIKKHSWIIPVILALLVGGTWAFFYLKPPEEEPVIIEEEIEVQTILVEAIENIEPEQIIMLNNANSTDLSSKSYMSISKITNEASNQWQYLVELDCVLVDDKGVLRVCNDTGFIITEDGYYGVAMGSYWGDIGSKYIVVLDTGIELKVVKVDEKADVDTNKENTCGATHNDLIEFVIDDTTAYMQSNWSFTRYDGIECASNGLVYNGNFNNSIEFNGNVASVEKVE